VNKNTAPGGNDAASNGPEGNCIMSTTLTHVNRERLLAELSDMPTPDLFQLLDGPTRHQLETEFSALSDDEDNRELMFSVIRNSSDFVDLSLRHAQRWESFLGDADLLVNYAAEIERNHLNQWE
jgi:hypothetical protein